MEYPKGLVEHLRELEAEGNEIFTSHSQDETLWFIPIKTLPNWVVVLSWFPGTADYQCVNITGKAFKRLQKVMTEVGG